MNDSDRNILASLAHEADEACPVCHQGVSPTPCNPPGSWYWEFTIDTPTGEEPVHEECLMEHEETVAMELEAARERVAKFLAARSGMSGPFDPRIVARVGVAGSMYDLTEDDLRVMSGWNGKELAA